MSKGSYLIIGKRLNKSKPELAGGVIVLFEQLLSDLDYHGLNYEVVDINYQNYGSKPKAFFLIYKAILLGIRKHETVWLNGSNAVVLYYLPFLLLLSVITRKKVVLRLFGGRFDQYHISKPSFIRYLIKLELQRVNIVFFETKYLVEKYALSGVPANWFPNVRTRGPQTLKLVKSRCDRRFEGKFVFLGHVKPEKGIPELLEAKAKLQDKFKLHIYGPISNLVFTSQQKDIFDEVYMGALAPEKVFVTLAEYDVLVLPTKWRNEGYPGTVIEALALNMPIIASDLPGIREMVTQNCAILVKPGSVESLVEAILAFDVVNFNRYVSAANKCFERFNASKQMPRIFEIVENC